MGKLHLKLKNQINDKKLKVRKSLVLHEYYTNRYETLTVGRFDPAEQHYLSIKGRFHLTKVEKSRSEVVKRLFAKKLIMQK